MSETGTGPAGPDETPEAGPNTPPGAGADVPPGGGGAPAPPDLPPPAPMAPARGLSGRSRVLLVAAAAVVGVGLLAGGGFALGRVTAPEGTAGPGLAQGGPGAERFDDAPDRDPERLRGKLPERDRDGARERLRDLDRDRERLRDLDRDRERLRELVPELRRGLCADHGDEAGPDDAAGGAAG